MLGIAITLHCNSIEISGKMCSRTTFQDLLNEYSNLTLGPFQCSIAFVRENDMAMPETFCCRAQMEMFV